MKLLYQFEAADSFLHRLDPRTKILFIVCYLVVTFIVPHPWTMTLIIIVILWVLGRIPPSEYYPVLIFFLPIMIAITLIHVFLIGPEPKLEILPGVRASLPGWHTGSVIAFRLAAMGTAFLLFSMTTDPFDWGLSLYNLGLPYKAAFMFAFAFRFLPLIQEEMVTIQSAYRGRGSEALSSYNPVTFLIGVATSVFPLGLGALRKSQNIALAMELRGFSYPEETGSSRVIFRDVRMRPADWAVVALSLLLVVAAAWLDRTGVL